VNTLKPTRYSNDCAHIRLYKSYFEEPLILSHNGDDNRLNYSFYANVHSLMMGQ
jgi:hypothetical protein